MTDYKFAIQAKHLNKTYNKKNSKKVKALIDFNIDKTRWNKIYFFN